MQQSRAKHVHRLLAVMIVALGAFLPCRGQVPASPSSATLVDLPSPQRFDDLYQRLYFGDLSTLDSKAERRYVAQLQALLPAGDAHRQRLLDTLHCDLDFDNAPGQGLEFAERRLAEAEHAGDTDAVIRFLYCRGDYRDITSTPDASLADYQRGIELARSNNEPALLAWGLLERGGTYSLLGIYGRALADLLEAKKTFDRLELPQASNQTLQEIGIAYRRLGDDERAREFLQESIAHEERANHKDMLTISLIQLAYADQESGDYASALQLMQRTLRLAQQSDDREMVGSSHLAIAGVLNDMGRHRQAQQELDSAERDFKTSGDAADSGMVNYERGRAFAGLGKPERAISEFEKAEQAFGARGNRRYQELVFKAKAQVLEASGHPGQALVDYKKYLAAREDVERQRTNQQAQMLREQFDTERSDLENARLKSEQALKDRQVDALMRARRWQWAATILLAILLAMLAVLAGRQLRKLRRWKRMASLDPLTGVANRRGIEEFLVDAMREARHSHTSLSVLVIDIDRFKRINDDHGHAAGDRALVRIAHACQAVLREHDLIGRIGGEEFLAVLPGSALGQARDVAERLRAQVESLVADCKDGIASTISIGIAEMMTPEQTMDALLQQADEALYRAKAQGRNQVACAAPRRASAHAGGEPGPTLPSDT